MQSHVEPLENGISRMQWMMKLHRLVIDRERTFFVILIGFMAAWGWVTLLEITRDPEYLCHQSIYLGVAVVVFGLMQWLDLKWLAKYYWVWLPLMALVSLFLPNRYYFSNSPSAVIVFVIFLTGLLSNEPWKLSFRFFQERIAKAPWYPMVMKTLLAIIILCPIIFYFELFNILNFIPLLLSWICVMFTATKDPLGSRKSSIAANWFVLLILVIIFLSNFSGSFYSSTLVAETADKLHKGGIIGGWIIPASPVEFWEFANGEYAFATIGQVHGFLGITCLIVLYLLFGFFGLRAAARAKDWFSATLVLGTTFLIVNNGLLSVLAGCGTLRASGFTLPFFTYGGGNLILGMFTAGLINKQLRVEPGDNLLQLDQRRIFFFMAGLALMVWVKTMTSMV